MLCQQVCDLAERKPVCKMAAITEPISVKSPGKISKRVEKELHQTKVVIRRLPPDFTQEKLLESIPLFPDHYFFYFSPGDPTAGALGCSRAYIGFSNEEDIPPFHAQYDGSIFESEKGVKYRAVIEFAPYQGVPKKMKRKLDVRCGTIEQDSDYKFFVESLEAKAEPLSSVELSSYLEGPSSKAPENQTTPLIEYLRDRRSKSRGRGRGSSVEVRKKQKGDSSSKSKTPSKSGKSEKFEKDTSKISKSKSSRSKHDSKFQEETKHHSHRSTSGTVSTNHIGNDTSTPTSSLGADRGQVKEKGLGEKDDKGKVIQNGDVREGRDRGGGKGRRNRERPDRAIYTPRNRSSDQLSGSPSGRSNPKEYDGRARDGGESYSCSKHGDKSSNHRFYDRDKSDEYAQRDRSGGRDKEHTYDDTRELKKKPRERYRSGGGGGRGRDGQYQGGRSSRGGERKKYSDSEFHDR